MEFPRQPPYPTLTYFGLKVKMTNQHYFNGQMSACYVTCLRPTCMLERPSSLQCPVYRIYGRDFTEEIPQFLALLLPSLSSEGGGPAIDGKQHQILRSGSDDISVLCLFWLHPTFVLISQDVYGCSEVYSCCFLGCSHYPNH